MFFLSHIWKKGTGWSLGAIVFAMLLAIFPQPVSAAGEAYTWANADDTSFTASGGHFGSTAATFTKSGDAGGGATFIANATYDCGSGPQTSQLTVTVDARTYKQSYPTMASSITGGASGCLFTSPTINKAGINQVTGASAEDEQCNQGGFTWLLCPVIDNLSKAVSNLAKDVLEPMLAVKPITQQNTPDLYKVWTQVRDLTGVLFVVVFFVIIAGTLMQQDIGFFNQYTVKKVLPRLVLAAILVQFSFIFAAVIVDIGNVMGAGIGNLLMSVAPSSSGPATFSNLVGNLVVDSVLAVTGLGALAVLASGVVAVPILVSLLLSLLVVFLTLGARYLLIAVLIALSPLAMLAWVLPNTEEHAQAWFKLLFRLVLMYPLVIGILSFAGIVNQILPFSGETAASGPASVAVWLIKPLIVIAAFLIIPVSFNLAGKALNRAYGLLNGVSQRGQGLLKGSDMWQRGLEKRQERQNSLMGRVLQSKSITSLQSKGALGRGAAGLVSAGTAMALMRAPSSTQALQRSNSALLASTKKKLEGLDEAGNPSNLNNALTAYEGRTAAERSKARAAGMRDAPNLMQLGSTPLGRTAMKQLLSDREHLTSKIATQGLATSSDTSLFRLGAPHPADFAKDVSVVQAKRKALPAVVLRMTRDDPNYMVKNAIGNDIAPAPRTVGSVDINAVSGVHRNLNATHLRDPAKYSLENYKVMQQAGNNQLPAVDRQVGRDFTTGFLNAVDAGTITKMVDVSNPFNDIAPSVRIEFLQGLRANAGMLVSHPEYRAQYEAATSHLNNDEKVTEALTAKMVNEGYVSDFDLSAFGPEAKAQLVRDWVKGESYNDDPASYYTKAVRYERDKRQAEAQARIEKKLRNIQVNQTAQQKAQEKIDAENDQLNAQNPPGPTP